LTSRSDVAFWWQLALVPLPLLKFTFAGSQAMSPAAAITGAAMVNVAAALRPVLPALSRCSAWTV
jgi:hypothetical protein